MIEVKEGKCYVDAADIRNLCQELARVYADDADTVMLVIDQALTMCKGFEAREIGACTRMDAKAYYSDPDAAEHYMISKLVSGLGHEAIKLAELRSETANIGTLDIITHAYAHIVVPMKEKVNPKSRNMTICKEV